MDTMQSDWGGSASPIPVSEKLETVRVKDCERCREGAHKSELLLSQILQGTFIPTFVIDSSRMITHWNKALESMTGLSAAEMIGTRNHWRMFYQSERPLIADFVVENASEETISRYFDGKCRKSTIIETAYEIEDYFPGLKRWLYFTAVPLTDVSGRIIGAIETLQDITGQKIAQDELRKNEQRYRELSITDSLTKLYNSRHFFRQLANEVERAKRYGIPLSLILMDIDDFKRYNDSYGHLEGDKALRTLSDVVKRNMRACDSAYRYGGEEFTVLLPETESEQAFVAAERLRMEFEKEALTPNPGSEAHLTVSIGISRYIPDEQPSTFLKRADEGMYKAKKMGKNRTVLARQCL